MELRRPVPEEPFSLAFLTRPSESRDVDHGEFIGAREMVPGDVHTMRSASRSAD